MSSNIKTGKLQTILFPRSHWKLSEAVKWLTKHNFKTTFNRKAVDITQNFYRFRQSKPARGQYFTINLENGIQMVFVK